MDELDQREEVRRTLDGVARGERPSAGNLLPLVYEELRGLAERALAGERRGHTLQATALVHEAFLRLVDGTQVDWKGRTHFFAVAATSVRRVLVQHARARHARKRGGGRGHVTIHEDMLQAVPTDDDLLALDESLERLAVRSAVQAQVVEMRFFAGMTEEEAAAALDTSPRTVRRHWNAARAWLRRDLAAQEEA